MPGSKEPAENLPQRDKSPERVNYDRIRDENRQLSMSQFVLLTIGMLYEYWSVFFEANAFHKETHTFDEWMRSFGGYLSF